MLFLKMLYLINLPDKDSDLRVLGADKQSHSHRLSHIQSGNVNYEVSVSLYVRVFALRCMRTCTSLTTSDTLTINRPAKHL